MKSTWCWSAPAIPVSEEAAETIWRAVNAVSTCRNTFNFFDYLKIFRHYFTGDGKASCILATISDWFPKGEDSEFLTPKQHMRFRISDPKQHRRGFRISDAPNNTEEDSEFLIPQTIQERIQNFWFPNNTGDSEFLIPQTTQERIQNFWFPKQQRRGYRISDPLNKNTIQEGFQYFGTPKNIVVESEFLITQTTWEKLHIFFSYLKAVKCLKIWGWSQHMILEQCKDWLFHDINFIQSLV